MYKSRDEREYSEEVNKSTKTQVIKEHNNQDMSDTQIK
jgi:hypothetical protein